MVWNSISSRILLMFTLLIITALTMGRASDIHNIEKRQIGVLARTGALPQGKRSVQALARNGELSRHNSAKREAVTDYTLDLLIKELGTAESLSRLRLQALAERLLEERDPEQESFGDVGKRSVAALARSGELPQKRLTEVGTRSGYLIKPPHETVRPPSDLFDPDDFLGKNVVEWLAMNGGFEVADGKPNGLAKHGYLETGEPYSWGDRRRLEDQFYESKRNLGSFKNFGKQNQASDQSYGKRNLGSAKNFLIQPGAQSSNVHGYLNRRSVGAAKNFLLENAKRTVGSARNFLLSRNNDPERERNVYRKKSLAALARDGGFSSLRYPSSKEQDWDDASDFDDFHEEDKKNVGSTKNFGKREIQDYWLNQRNNAVLKEKYPRTRENNLQGPSKPNDKANSQRKKREAYIEESQEEYPMPFFQNLKKPDYEDFPGQFYEEENALEKRFLGSLDQRIEDEAEMPVVKRHIGALARLGWLPSLRSIRYSRSGRAINDRIASSREDPTVGAYPSESPIPIFTSPTSSEAKLAIE